MSVGEQRVLSVTQLPESSLMAAEAFMADHLEEARALLSDDAVAALAIALPAAGPEHKDWRTAIARDLAREYTPKRVNVAAGAPGKSLEEVLAYLGNAPGVTGHYVEAHD